MKTRARGFPAMTERDARILVLGSLPGRQSIAACEYYAHPRNVFWRIVEDLLAIRRTDSYSARLKSLGARGVALWDVLWSSQRQGSLDAAIETRTAVANDFAGFFEAHREFRLVAFNGRKAAELYSKLVAPTLATCMPETVVLPSTSPAHAAMSYTEKLHRWSMLLDVLKPDRNPRDSEHRQGLH